ncbi:hypothetical protein D3C87_1023770 [compost metagenome]
MAVGEGGSEATGSGVGCGFGGVGRGVTTFTCFGGVWGCGLGGSGAGGCWGGSIGMIRAMISGAMTASVSLRPRPLWIR